MMATVMLVACGDKEEDSASDTAVAEDTAEWIKLKRGDSTQGSTDNIRPGKE